ncbi:MAG: hypothetical protein ABIK36_11200 [Pseudomonadota bacterium]
MKPGLLFGWAPHVAALIVTLGVPAPVWASMDTDVVSGRIGLYECGDNCYLTIRTEDGEDLTGLCAAPECEAWNENAEMPADFVGRAVTVTIEMGEQTDADGNVMGEFPAFTAITFDN